MAAGIALADLTEDAPRRAVSARQQGSARKRVALLAKALETDVIPRLVLSRHEPGHPNASMDLGTAGPSAEDVESLVDCVLRGDSMGGMAIVAALRARDVPLERIYLELMAPVARHLGELWTRDACDFTSVTVGLCCLQQLVLENGSAFGPRLGRPAAERRIMLAPVPGEQHSFGLLIVGEFFRRQGWEVCSGNGASAREIVALTRKQDFSLVGFSMACESRLDMLATLIRDIRRAARNRRIGILVGGQAFAERPELAALVGADATATDGQQAVLKAETLLTLLAHQD
jgi:methanogenic corrinoid protein MtbC1